jgi:hypothetical protein
MNESIVNNSLQLAVLIVNLVILVISIVAGRKRIVDTFIHRPDTKKKAILDVQSNIKALVSGLDILQENLIRTYQDQSEKSHRNTVTPRPDELLTSQ